MGASSRVRFLAVDDEADAAQIYGALLRKYGEPVVVRSVAEADAELARGGAFDAFLFDLRLGDGSGLELLSRARKKHPRTPALVMSGHVEGWVVNDAFDLGAETLAKPFDASRLHHWIERALGMNKPLPADTLEPVELRGRVESLRQLLAQKPAEPATRYLIGSIIADLKDQPDRYGDRAVAVAAAVLGQDEAGLYRHARVAERWTPAAFEALLARKTRDGKSPSWSHLVLLATVMSDKLLDRVVARLLDENLSVRQLDEALRQVGVHTEEP